MNILVKIEAELSAKLEGKRTIKLLEVVQEWIGIGLGLEKKKRFDEIDAEAYKIVKIAEAEKEAELISKSPELIHRTQSRVTLTEVIRQENIEGIVAKTPKFLEAIPEADDTDNDVSNEWKTKFFQKAADVSEENLQEIWAQILAHEVAKPGTVGLRTIETLGNLSSKEAKRFEKLCSMALSIGVVPSFEEKGVRRVGVSFSDLLDLADAGLIVALPIIATISYEDSLSGWGVLDPPLSYGDRRIKIVPTESSIPDNYKPGPISIDGYHLTNAGKELFHIVDAKADSKYLNLFDESLGEQLKIFEVIS